MNFAKKIKKTTQDNFDNMHLNEAVDYAIKHVKEQIKTNAEQGSTSCSIDMNNDIYKYVVKYIMEHTEYNKTQLPWYSDWCDLLVRWVDSKLKRDDSFSPADNNMDGLPVIRYRFEDHASHFIKFDWSNMF